jgi:hypothetical protein
VTAAPHIQQRVAASAADEPQRAPQAVPVRQAAADAQDDAGQHACQLILDEHPGVPGAARTGRHQIPAQERLADVRRITHKLLQPAARHCPVGYHLVEALHQLRLGDWRQHGQVRDTAGEIRIQLALERRAGAGMPGHAAQPLMLTPADQPGTSPPHPEDVNDPTARLT